MSISREEVYNLIQVAKHTNNPVINTALQQEQAFRKATEQQLTYLGKEIIKHSSKFDLEKKRAEILSQQVKDTELILSMNIKLKAYKPGETVDYSLYTNKMYEAINGVSNLTTENRLENRGAKGLIESHFYELVCDKLPDEYNYISDDHNITILGDNSTIYGNSKGTFLKTALINTFQSFIGDKNLADLPLITENMFCIDHSAFLHVVPLPSDLLPENIDNQFRNCNYYFSDALTPNGFAFIHSGYAFGGHRNQSRYKYPPGKASGPEDCSSWVTKLISHGKTDGLTTLDYLYTFRAQTMQYTDTIPNQWPITALGKFALNTHAAVPVRDPQKDIKLGQIYVHRKFTKEQTKLESTGSGGHMALVLGFNSHERKVVALGYGRDMPTQEGFGIQTFPIQSDEETERMFFNLIPT